MFVSIRSGQVVEVMLPGEMQAERWALIGNAVTVPVAKWLGTRLMQPYRCTLVDSTCVETHKQRHSNAGHVMSLLCDA